MGAGVATGPRCPGSNCRAGEAWRLSSRLNSARAQLPGVQVQPRSCDRSVPNGTCQANLMARLRFLRPKPRFRWTFESGIGLRLTLLRSSFHHFRGLRSKITARFRGGASQALSSPKEVRSSSRSHNSASGSHQAGSGVFALWITWITWISQVNRRRRGPRAVNPPRNLVGETHLDALWAGRGPCRQGGEKDHQRFAAAIAARRRRWCGYCRRPCCGPALPRPPVSTGRQACGRSPCREAGREPSSAPEHGKAGLDGDRKARSAVEVQPRPGSSCR